MNAIYKFVLGMIGKRSGVVTTLPSQKQVEFQANMLAEKFMQNGIDPNALKSPEQVKNVLANIDQANMRVIPADSAEGKGITEKFLGKKKADVMDMEGNKIPDDAKIMGGKQIQPINMTVEERTGGLLKGKYESDEAIKARLVADNKKGIKSIKINLVDDSIAKIKSLEPIEAMKEANLVAGKKGRYANLDDNQVKKIMDDTQEHIFQDSSPLDDYATGGRVGLKGGAFLNFIKKMGKTINDKSPAKVYTDYLKSVKDRAQKGDMKTLAPELGIIAGGGILTNRFLKKKLEKMTEDVKSEVENKAKQNLEKKADGGRIGYFMGSAYPKGAAALREMLKYFGKKSDSVKNPSDILKIVNPKQFNRMLEDPRIYGKFDVEKGIAAPDLIKDMQKKMMSDRQSTVKEMLGSAKNIKKLDDDTLNYKNQMIKELMAKGADRKMAEEMAETISKIAENAAGKSNTPKLSDEGILQLENILKNMETGGKKPRDLNADGGRIGLQGGGSDASKSDFKTSTSQSTNREKGIMSRGQGPKGTTGNINNNNNNNNDGPKGPPSIINPPPKDNNPPIQTTSDDSVNRGFLSDVRKKNQQRYLGILNKYKPDDFDVMNQIDGISNLTEEEAKFMERYGAGKKYKDLSKTNIENFFEITDGVAPKVKDLEMDVDRPRQYDFAADGGRIGYKAGSVDKMRRLFLKAIGAGTAGVGAAKSGIFSFGKGAGKTVAKEVAQQTTSSMPPPYFFKLAEKIKMMGDDATATTDRTIAKTLKSKDGKSTYLLEEDVTTGDTIIKKINKEGDEMITDVEIMELKKGEVVMGKDGKPIRVPDEYEEVTEANARIEGDVYNDPYYSDGIQVDEIIKEVDDTVPSIKYASGGLAYMLGE